MRSLINHVQSVEDTDLSAEHRSSMSLLACSWVMKEDVTSVEIDAISGVCMPQQYSMNQNEVRARALMTVEVMMLRRSVGAAGAWACA